MEQANDNVNKMKAAVTDLPRDRFSRTSPRREAALTIYTSQMQALSESLDEAKARLSKLSDQMAQMQNTLTTLPPSGPRRGSRRAARELPAPHPCPTPTRFIPRASAITMAGNTIYPFSPFRII